MENLHQITLNENGIQLDGRPVRGVHTFCLDSTKPGRATLTVTLDVCTTSALEVGKVYINRNGDRYLCKSAEGDGKYTMERMSDSWITKVSLIRHYSDGTVDWEWGARTPFEYVSEAEDVHP